ncbi:hypothetical protein N0V83_002527 [Neocucurbitaria cava]|uniref:Uncharacterized protein n=1 Tax=Neocucurbitaria cava TaxID=798079 RepID=A0A9W9CPL4_9PLEO|nr:hypothetical protein N0V83_002527 [Neocucurbitaria cava]
MGTNLVAWFLCYWLVPNTGNEELEDVFERLLVPTKFAFIYTCASLWRKITKPVDYCLRMGRKTWVESGHGRPLEAVEFEFQQFKDMCDHSEAARKSLKQSGKKGKTHIKVAWKDTWQALSARYQQDMEMTAQGNETLNQEEKELEDCQNGTLDRRA